MINSSKKTIIIIDDSPANIQLILASLKTFYRIIPFTSAKDAIEYFEKGHTCDLVLLDIEMPDVNGMDALVMIKMIPTAKNIPVIFLTGRIDTQSEIEGLSLGAVDYIYKPANPLLVKKRIDMHIALEEYSSHLQHMVDIKTKTIEKLSDVTIATVISMIGSHDQETRGHINRTSEYVAVLAQELVSRGLYEDELTPDNIHLLRKSAPLHDIGKVGVDASILKKPGKLTFQEFEQMKLHTIIGGNALAEAIALMNEPSFLDMAMVLAMGHHERWDGMGYPYHLKGESIPIFARIMSIADVYDALISKRPYKNKMSHQQAVDIITQGHGTRFDPNACDAFLHINDNFDSIAKEFEDHKTIPGVGALPDTLYM